MMAYTHVAKEVIEVRRLTSTFTDDALPTISANDLFMNTHRHYTNHYGIFKSNEYH